MVNLTLSIPDDLKKEMDDLPEINWSEVARGAIKKRIDIFKRLREFTKDSEITEEDAIKFGRLINKSLAKRWNDETSR